MDFVVIEIFYLLWFSLTLGTFGSLNRTNLPINQVVPEGTENVTIRCAGSANPDFIIWSFTPAGSNKGKTIKHAASNITDIKSFGGSIDPVGKSYTLTVRNATASTAGTYMCTQSARYSVQLVVLHGEASCDRFPRDSKQPPCNSTLQLSCALNYSANTHFINAALIWSSDNVTELSKFAVNSSSPPGTTTTATSRLNVTWPKEGNIPTYTCTATFTMNGSNSPNEMDTVAPARTTSCQPFTSPIACMRDGGTEAPKATEDPELSLSGSVRSAETNNLAIQVLGVAVMLLLAQMF